MSGIRGIDVSAHNGAIDWSKVRDAGIRFAVIRGGFGCTEDKRFAANLAGARAAGIAVGVYWFTYALDTAGAEAEADFCCRRLTADSLSLPVFCDFEYDTERYAKEQGVVYTKESRTAVIQAFCDRVRARGFRAGVYLNPDYIQYKVRYDRLKNYPLWLAQWVNSGVSSHDSVPAEKVSRAFGTPVLWQFGKGTIRGIGGYTDLNYLYEDLPDRAPEKKPDNSPMFAKGDKVRVKNTVSSGKRKLGRTYTGGTFVLYYDVYDVMQVSGSRVVIGIGNTVTAAVHRDSLEKA